MKLAILGAGSSGIQSACHFLAYLPAGWEVTLIYNPNIPAFGIGESTNGTFSKALKAGLNFDFEKDMHHLDATIKWTTKYENWRDQDFHGPLLTLGDGVFALHFNTFKLKDFALPRLKNTWGNKFKIIEGHVNSLVNGVEHATVTVDDAEYQYDFVMDSRGFSNDLDNYFVLQSPVLNHALIHNIPGDGTDWQYTVHRATVDGWMFQIPLSTRISNGYLFNDNLVSIEDAKKNFAKEINISIEELENIEYKFTPYYAKNVLENRIIKNGNTALFFEPMFGNSLWNYDAINRLFFEYITGETDDIAINSRYITHVHALKDMFYFKYHGGSIYNTEFWNKTVNVSKEKLNESMSFHNALLLMKKIKTNNFYGNFNWVYGTSGLDLVDTVFGYNYFKI